MEKIDERTYKFALRILKLVDALPHSTKGETLARQVLRSGTSIGANVEEAYGGSSKKDFANKMATALKEARETHFWLRLIRDDGMIPSKQIEPLIQEALEIKLILGKTVSTSKKSKSNTE